MLQKYDNEHRTVPHSPKSIVAFYVDQLESVIVDKIHQILEQTEQPDINKHHDRTVNIYWLFSNTGTWWNKHPLQDASQFYHRVKTYYELEEIHYSNMYIYSLKLHVLTWRVESGVRGPKFMCPTFKIQAAKFYSSQWGTKKRYYRNTDIIMDIYICSWCTPDL